ncbi:hypothetical protein ACSS6W_003340 [Trichoderma asperelloides]
MAEMASQDEGGITDTRLSHRPFLETPAYATLCNLLNVKLLAYMTFINRGV